MQLFNTVTEITVGARDSKLSQIQTQEVQTELNTHFPQISFKTHYMKTKGDLDQSTSLKQMSKTDFFTQEIEINQLNKKFRISIHSAKDLPENLRPGLTILAITKGVDPSDSLVLKEGMTLETLPSYSAIGSSSLRREEVLLSLRSDLKVVDIRGTIPARLQLLEEGTLDGVIIAEAALIRLGWNHLNRMTLPGSTTPFQGQLAIVGLEEDQEMKEIFQCIDSRQSAALST